MAVGLDPQGLAAGVRAAGEERCGLQRAARIVAEAQTNADQMGELSKLSKFSLGMY